MSKPQNFMQLALRGEVLSDEIEDFIDRWHESDSAEEIHEYLGMTFDEYSLWVSHPDYINLIIFARQNERPLLEAVNDNLHSSNRLAARANDTGRLTALKRWIAAQSDR